MPSPLRALRHRNFALFTAGQACALIGYWVQQIAVSWLVYRLTGSATLLGVLSFAANVPVLLLAPVAGIWSDRFNRHRMMLATQVLEMLQAIALAVLAYGGWIEVWHVVALTVMLGLCVAVELPVRHAYLLELVGDKRHASKLNVVFRVGRGILECRRRDGLRFERLVGLADFYRTGGDFQRAAQRRFR